MEEFDEGDHVDIVAASGFLRIIEGFAEFAGQNVHLKRLAVLELNH